jgi:hypothetical protein
MWPFKKQEEKQWNITWLQNGNVQSAIRREGNAGFYFVLHESGESRRSVSSFLAVLTDKRTIFIHALYNIDDNNQKKKQTPEPKR